MLHSTLGLCLCRVQAPVHRNVKCGQQGASSPALGNETRDKEAEELALGNALSSNWAVGFEDRHKPRGTAGPGTCWDSQPPHLQRWEVSGCCFPSLLQFVKFLQAYREQ